MSKALCEMTLEELWQLFPIILSPHQACWADWYAVEEKRLLGLPEMNIVRISHIGSTAVKKIWAKPIVDILLEVPDSISVEKTKAVLTGNGYICMSEEKNRKSFNKGYTPNGFEEKVFHLHLRVAGDNDELYFRDYLNENTAVANEYEALKLSLWKKYEHNRDAYTNAKTAFVKAHTKTAKEKYGKRYD